MKNFKYLSLFSILVLGIFLIYNYNKGENFYIEEIFLIMSIPGFDFLRLFFVRSLNKKNPLKPDLNHFHHILLKKYNQYTVVILVMTILFVGYLIGSNTIFGFNLNESINREEVKKDIDEVIKQYERVSIKEKYNSLSIKEKEYIQSIIDVKIKSDAALPLFKDVVDYIVKLRKDSYLIKGNGKKKKTKKTRKTNRKSNKKTRKTKRKK